MSLIGQKLGRIDGPDKATGQAKYTADIILPGMLYGKILRSPYPHARILNIDTGKAERLPGLKAVITWKDTSEIRWSFFGIADRGILAKDKARFIGDEVAAVAAVDENIGEEALDLIKVDYEELPPVFDPEEAIKSGASQIHDQIYVQEQTKTVYNNTAFAWNIHRGNIEGGFQDAHSIVEGRFTTHPVHQCYLDTISAVCCFDSSENLILYTSSMHPSGLRLSVANALGLPPSKVRLIQYHVGGAFGTKVTMHPTLPICAFLAKKAGKPVKIALTREEEFIAGRPRNPFVIELKIGVKKDGTPIAKQANILLDSGAYTDSGYTVVITTLATFRTDNLYRFINLKTESRTVYTNKTPGGAYRGFGNPQMTFAVEQMLDIAMEKIGMDPMEFRLRYGTRKGDVTAHGWQIQSCGLGECIEKAVDGINWKEKWGRRQRGRGVGIGCMVHETDARIDDNYGGSTAYVKVKEDGKVVIISGEPEYGQGTDTTFALIASEVLGIPLNHVSVAPRDTDLIPYSLGPWGSRVITAGGKAVMLAAQDARRQLLDVASNILEANIEDLEMKDAKIFVKEYPDKAIPISAAAKTALYCKGVTQAEGGAAIVGKGFLEPTTDNVFKQDLYGNPCSAYMFASQAVEVEVDEETGRVKVLQFLEADDCGKVLNRHGAEGQSEGAVAQGFGYALTEDIIREQGKVMNPSFLGYGIPTSVDVPPIKVVLVESKDPYGPFGAKGIGETGINIAAGAVANAIYEAVGVRIKNLPITPEKILKTLETKEKKDE